MTSSVRAANRLGPGRTTAARVPLDSVTLELDDPLEREILWRYDHVRGTNCTTTALSNLSRHFGLELSEELCLGIGGGLGFTYFRGAGVPYFLAFGRSDDLEINFARAVGYDIALQSAPNAKVAWRSVIHELHATGPVMLDTDAGKLHYPGKSGTVAWSDASHGGHKLVVIGWHPQSAEVTLCDYLWSDPQRIPISNLWAAWQSDPGPAMATHHYWYKLLVPTEFVALPHAIREGVRLNLFRMTEPWNRFYGIAALRGFLKGVCEWRYVVPEAKRCRQAKLVFASLETGGTGKGAFRRMYARFLREAADILGEPAFLELGREYLALARKWSELAGLLAEGAEHPERGIYADRPENEQLTRELLSGEEAALARLGQIALTWA